MKTVIALSAPLILAIALAGCRAEQRGGGSQDPAPTADSHQPQNPGSYGTGAQETRDDEEARAADSPNDDGNDKDDDGRRRELPARAP